MAIRGQQGRIAMGLDPTSQLSTRSTSLLARSGTTSGSDSDSGTSGSNASAPAPVANTASSSLSNSSSWATTYDPGAGNGRGWPRSAVPPTPERPASATAKTSSASAQPVRDDTHPRPGPSSIIPLSYVPNTTTSAPTIGRESPASKPSAATTPAPETHHVSATQAASAAAPIAAVSDLSGATSSAESSAVGSDDMEGQRLHSIAPYEGQIDPAAVARVPPVPVSGVEDDATAPAVATTVVPRVVTPVPSGVRGMTSTSTDVPGTLGGFPLSQFMRKPKRRS